MLVAVASQGARADDLQKVVIQTVALEAVMATVSLADEKNKQNGVSTDLSDFSWELTFSDRNWRLDAKGAFGEMPFGFVMSGYLWGDAKQNLLTTYSGGGQLGDERLHINGKSELPFNKELSGYGDMAFNHVVKFGDNSTWGWIVGTEIIVGGALAAGGAVFTTTVATAGASLPALFIIGAAAAPFGAEACITISEAVKSIGEPNEPVPQPDAPSRPIAPDNNTPLSAEPGRIIIAVDANSMRGSEPSGRYMLTGNNYFEKGVANGSVGQIDK